MNTNEIAIEIEGIQFDMLVVFDFIKGFEPITDRAVGLCSEGSPDVYEIQHLAIIEGETRHCVDFLIKPLESRIIELLQE